MFIPETFMIAKAAARGVLVATICSSSAIGTNSANGILKTVDVDLAVTKSPGDSSNAPAIGAREDCRCLWSAPTCRRVEKRGRVRAVQKFRGSSGFFAIPNHRDHALLSLSPGASREPKRRTATGKIMSAVPHKVGIRKQVSLNPEALCNASKRQLEPMKPTV